MQLIRFVFLGIILSSCAINKKTDYSLNNLTCDSFQVRVTYFPKLYLDEQAQAILNSKMNKEVLIKKLYSKIQDKEKTKIINVLLTKLIEPENDILKYDILYNEEGKVKYSYNNIQWVDDDCYFSESAIIKSKEYWRKKIF